MTLRIKSFSDVKASVETVTCLRTFRRIVIVYFRVQAAEETYLHDPEDEGITIFFLNVGTRLPGNFQEYINFQNLLYLEMWLEILWYISDRGNQKQSNRLLTCYYAI